MVKKLWTMTALAVVVAMLVGACASSTASPSAVDRTKRRGAERGPERRGVAERRAVRLRRSSISRRSRPATPSWTRHSVPTSRSTARRSRSRPSGSAARAKASQRDQGLRRRRPASRSRSTASARATRPCSRPASRAAARRTWRRWHSRPPCSRTRGTASSRTSPRSWAPRAPRSSRLNSRRRSASLSEGDKIWSIPTKADVKSMIWYPVKAFAAEGLRGSQDLGRARRPGRQDRRRRQRSVLRQRRRPRHGDGLAADGLGRGSAPQDRGSAGHQRLDQRQDPVHRPQDQGRLRPGRLAPVQGRLRRRRWPGHREHRHDGPSWIRCSTRTRLTPGCWMQKIPVWYGPDFFPDKPRQRR